MAGPSNCGSCGAELAENTAFCVGCGAGPDSVDSLVGREIADKFVLRELIGAGASGRVYSADQTALGRTVAVKILHPHLAKDATLVERFHREALATSRLNHPNTISVIDYGQTDDDYLYIVMEYLRGKTLTRLLRDQFPLPMDRILGLAQQILSGLEEAHACNVVHADLKCDNIMVESMRGGGDLVKVVDFGIAQLVDQTKKKDKDERKTVSGTPEYMAPEVIEGKETTPAADLYGAAVVFYELLTGETPFTGGSPLDVVMRHLKDEPEAPSERKPELDIPPQFEEAVLKALSKKPEDRQQDAAEFRAQLSEAFAGASISGVGILCHGCGVRTPQKFKFCPECGAPAQVAVATLPKLAKDPSPALASTREFDSVQQSDAQLFPLPLLGRDSNLSLIESFLSGGEDGYARLCFGPRGVGKSRLMRDACRRVAERGVKIYFTGPDPSGLATPWYPIRAVVAAMLRLPAVCTHEVLRDALIAIDLLERDLPGVAELFGTNSQLGQLEARARRREVTASARRVILASSKKSRVALVFDDLNEYDQPSIEFLCGLVVEPLDAPLRVLLGSTDQADEEFGSGLVQTEILPLGDDELKKLVAHLGRVSESMPNVDELKTMTGGLAEHIEHIVRYIVEGGEASTAPTGIADLIGTRCARLPQEARHILQAAAVAGDEVSSELLAATLIDELSDGDFTKGLAVLSGRGHLGSHGGVVSFRHGLVRDVVYESMPADVRRGYHAAYADSFEKTGGRTHVLADHVDLARDPKDAVAHLLRAGDESVRGFDDRGAAEMYSRALAAARRALLGDEGDDATEDFLRASVKLADALRFVGDLVVARGILDGALAVCDKRHQFYEAQLRRAQGHLAVAAGKPEAALGLLRDAIGMAIPAGDSNLMVDLYLDLAAMYLRTGATKEAAVEVEEGINLVTFGEGTASKDGPANMWRLAVRLAELYRALDRNRDALLVGLHALRHAERAKAPVGLGRVHSLLANLYEREHHEDKAAHHRLAAVEVMRRLGDRRKTAELLLAGVSPTARLRRIQTDGLREAKDLASEIGWTEGVDKASNLQD